MVSLFVILIVIFGLGFGSFIWDTFFNKKKKVPEEIEHTNEEAIITDDVFLPKTTKVKKLEEKQIQRIRTPLSTTEKVYGKPNKKEADYYSSNKKESSDDIVIPIYSINVDPSPSVDVDNNSFSGFGGGDFNGGGAGDSYDSSDNDSSSDSGSDGGGD